jgi:hypothetical protein
METLKFSTFTGTERGSSGDPSFVSLASFPQGPIPPPYSAPPLLSVLSPLLVADSDVVLQKKKKTLESHTDNSSQDHNIYHKITMADDEQPSDSGDQQPSG